MREHVQQWLAEKMQTPGILACGLRGADRKTLCRSQSAQFTIAAIDNTCRILADTFQILNANRFPSTLVRWVYENYFLYGSVRADGFCLAVLTHREATGLQPSELEQIIAEFQTLQT